MSKAQKQYFLENCQLEKLEYWMGMLGQERPASGAKESPILSNDAVLMQPCQRGMRYVLW